MHLYLFLLVSFTKILFIFMHPIVTTDTKQHLKFLKLRAHYSNAVTSY